MLRFAADHHTEHPTFRSTTATMVASPEERYVAALRLASVAPSCVVEHHIMMLWVVGVAWVGISNLLKEKEEESKYYENCTTSSCRINSKCRAKKLQLLAQTKEHPIDHTINIQYMLRKPNSIEWYT
jgi:hypothetical protein